MNVITTDEIPFLSATGVIKLGNKEELTTYKHRASLGFVERSLLASAYFPSGGTALYRIRGSDTLTIGQLDEWIEKKGVINVMILYAYNLSKPDLFRLKMINPAEVNKFLLKNTDLRPVLAEASRVVKQIFGEDAEIILELRNDPEIDYEILRANIKATGDIDEQLDKLDIFDDTWLVHQLDLINQRILFNLDFS
ncbi:hypothetical protein [Bellilinea sp.]|jgi:hypothetical protein|uniref:hypothetical protein n=1 Tax=Bellilinea sp. TaxID=2838785 RepID=UPI002ADE5597|nr:hypothetical protein [Bellilinea sp.]